jgi:hypothetical protein
VRADAASAMKSYGGAPAWKDVAMRWTWVAVLALLAGCDGIDLQQLVRQHEALMRVTQQEPGAHCARGGRLLQVGLDVDDDGVLDDSEVKRTDQVCDTAVPGVLVHLQSVPPGEQCPLGGQVSRAGTDTNGNGILEDGEMTREVYGCTEAAPVLVHLSDEPPSLGFCNTEGTRVRVGQDLDRDGVLDDSEVEGASRHCLSRRIVLTRQRVEPAGPQCSAAGTAVLVGTDSNGDGTLAEDEAHDLLYVCEAARVSTLNYTVKGAEDLAALEGITHLRGDLYIQGTALREVSIPGLVTMEGRISIHANPELLRVSMPGLRYVGHQLDVTNNPVLETLELGGARGRRLLVGGDVEVSGNARLPDLGGLRPVVPTQNLTVSGNAALTSLGGFEELTRLTGNLVISANGSLTSIILPALEQVGRVLHLSENAALPSLGTFSSLKSVGEDLVIADNDSLESLEGMPMLQLVGESFRVHENDALRTTAGLAQLRRLDHLAIFDNAQLESAGDMPALESISYGFAINGNPRLVALTHLPRLVHVGTFVNIHGNPLLTRLEGLERLLRLKQLTVQNNAALPGLASLAGLRELDDLVVRDNAALGRLDLEGLVRVSTRFIIADNPKLPRCLASALAEAAYKGLADDYVVEGNDDTATCEP